MWLVCADVDTEVNIKHLNKYVKARSGQLSYADEESLAKYLGCKKGNVNYFAMMNDTTNQVKMIIDQKLVDAEWAAFHPMDNTGSTCINKDGIFKLRDLAGRDESNFEVLDFSTLEEKVAAMAA